MEWSLVIFASILGILFALVCIYLFKQLQRVREDFQLQVSHLQQNVSQRFDANVQAVTSHLGIITGQMNNTTNVVSQVEGKLGQVQEATRQIFDLARQISSLQDVLQSPKMRGGMGEVLLNDLLSQCLRTGQYHVQYRFKGGAIVDAAVFVGKNVLCIDSKFPLDNFRRLYQCDSEPEKKNLRKLFFSDVKKHVNDIAEKYILPDEDTLDFALMFIPAENVYYELIVRDESDLYSHCLSRKVIPVSPNTFYAYLQVILLGLRGVEISEKARQIQSQLQQVSNDLIRMEGDFDKIGSHLRDAQSSYERTDARLQKLKRKVGSMGDKVLEEEAETAASKIEEPQIQMLDSDPDKVFGKPNV